MDAATCNERVAELSDQIRQLDTKILDLDREREELDLPTLRMKFIDEILTIIDPSASVSATVGGSGGASGDGAGEGGGYTPGADWLLNGAFGQRSHTPGVQPFGLARRIEQASLGSICLQMMVN